MAKNRFSVLPKQQQQQTPSSPPANTVGAVANPLTIEDDEDNDICPVCDGECTCDNKPRALPPTPLTMTQLSALHVASASRSNLSPSIPFPSPKPILPSLKIKLTVPQSMLGKRRAPPPNSNKSRGADIAIHTENEGENSSPFSDPPPYPATTHISAIPHIKRRGRPPKAVVATRNLAARPASDAHAANTFPIYPSQSFKNIKPKKIPVSRLPKKLKGAPVKKSAVNKRKRVVSSESSGPSDVDHHYDFDDDDAQSVQFPTFVSASALSSRASSSSSDSDDSLSSFGDSDSSIEAEEENFILSEVHDRARVKRELLGEENSKKRELHNAWVIRPRQKSAGPSDVEMDVDTDATEDEDEDEDEADEEDDETDGMRAGDGYVGVATGWSEDEDESSFDADLFFANLSDSQDSGSSTSSDNGGDDGDHSDLESMSYGESSITSLPPRYPDNLAFEVTEGWDGQVMFTNGLREGQGILDMEFETNAAQFVAETSASPSQESDVEMSSDVDDGGYEEDADGGEGDTTDEELVGDDDLPNERAMRLFNLPSSISAINPMSTMSPTVSPGPRPFGSRALDSPKPADILSGKVFWDSDDHDEFESTTTRSHTRGSSNGGGPRTGHFELAHDTRKAVIDDSHKVAPSPHPKFRRRQTSLSQYNTVEDMLRRHVLTPKSSIIAPSGLSSYPLSPTLEDTSATSPEIQASEIVDLNDVLEASFLDPDPSDHSGISADGDSRKPLKPFSRWDLLSVGAFRQTRDPSSDGLNGWGSDPPTPGPDYGSMMKASPLSTMLWQNKGKGKKQSRRANVVISPVIFPVKDRDGDRTPTNGYHVPPQQNHNNHSHKTRKELRRERKLKRKSFGPLQHQPHHQHHFHHHHPNSKNRSTSSSQRTNFFSIPPLNI